MSRKISSPCSGHYLRPCNTSSQIYESDTLIPAELRDQLISHVAKLENVPDEDKDWHPGSEGRVLDLVHPSLYPLIYGRTPLHTRNAAGELSVELSTAPEGPADAKHSTSKKCEWYSVLFTGVGAYSRHSQQSSGCRPTLPSPRTAR